MKLRLSIYILSLLVGFTAAAQDSTVYQNTKFYKVKDYTKASPKVDKPKNIIFLIGDGMGITQIYAGQIANKGSLYLNTFPVTGISKTSSSSDLITDSAAGATAFSIGQKTFNGAIGVDKDTVAVKTILEEAEEKGLATGLVSTSGITHATPASFIAHQPSRQMYEAIAADFLNTDIDLFIGGYRDHFNKRKDSVDLLKKLEQNGYEVVTDINKLKSAKGDKIAGLVAEKHTPPKFMGRGEMLSTTANYAVKKLAEKEKGFFLMIEGSQIDWGGHGNYLPYVVTEMLDFDQVVGEVLKFAAKDGETLVVVTADHETGGLSIIGGDLEKGVVEGHFSTDYHTAVPVMVYAYGPGAELFQGSYENTEIYHKMRTLLGW